MKRLEGKTVLATASGQGIGRASVLRMAEEGARVIATDVNGDTLATLDGTPGIETMRLDVTKMKGSLWWNVSVALATTCWPMI